MLSLGKKGLEKLTPPNFIMPLIQANAKYCIDVTTATEVFSPLHGYVAVMIYIHNLRILVIGAGSFTWEHFFMLFNLRSMYFTVQFMSMLLKQTSQWSPLVAFLVCITVKSQRTKPGFFSSETYAPGVHLVHSELYWCFIHNPRLEQFWNRNPQKAYVCRGVRSLMLSV